MNALRASFRMFRPILFSGLDEAGGGVVEGFRRRFGRGVKGVSFLSAEDGVDVGRTTAVS